MYTNSQLSDNGKKHSKRPATTHQQFKWLITGQSEQSKALVLQMNLGIFFLLCCFIFSYVHSFLLVVNNRNVLSVGNTHNIYMTICEFCSWLPRLWTSAMRKSMSSLSSLDIHLLQFIPGGFFSEFSSVRTYSNVKCKESTYSNFAQNVRWLIDVCIEVGDITVSLRCKFYHCSCSDKMMGSFANIYMKGIFVSVINLRSNRFRSHCVWVTCSVTHACRI